MRCPSADRASRHRLLEAEPGELAGTGDTPLARHVATCARCRARAGRILEAHAELDGVLGRSAPLDDAGLDRILARAAETKEDAGRRRRWRWAAPAVAAAAAAVLWLVSDEPPGPGPEGTTPPAAPGARRAPAGPDPVVAGGATAAVFATSNPEITVVWILEGDS